MTRLPAVCTVSVALLLTAACSSSPAGSSKATSTTDTSPPANATTSAPDITPTSPAPSTTLGPGAARAIGASPAVGNATNLQTAPTISAGIGSPPTALIRREIVLGRGALAGRGATVDVQYVGANFADGQVFDSSWQRGGQPVTFPLSGVIPGFAQGIAGMRVGGRRELVIPPALGYGASGQPPAVGPNETLVFVVDLVGVQ